MMRLSTIGQVSILIFCSVNQKLSMCVILILNLGFCLYFLCYARLILSKDLLQNLPNCTISSSVLLSQDKTSFLSGLSLIPHLGVNGASVECYQ